MALRGRGRIWRWSICGSEKRGDGPVSSGSERARLSAGEPGVGSGESIFAAWRAMHGAMAFPDAGKSGVGLFVAWNGGEGLTRRLAAQRAQLPRLRFASGLWQLAKAGESYFGVFAVQKTGGGMNPSPQAQS